MIDISEPLERSLLSACLLPGGASNRCATAIQEHFAAGGSRIRARICLSAGASLGIHPADTMRIATVCELLHNASLYPGRSIWTAPQSVAASRQSGSGMETESLCVR